MCNILYVYDNNNFFLYSAHYPELIALYNVNNNNNNNENNNLKQACTSSVCVVGDLTKECMVYLNKKKTLKFFMDLEFDIYDTHWA